MYDVLQLTLESPIVDITHSRAARRLSGIIMSDSSEGSFMSAFRQRGSGRLRFSYLFKSVNVLITELGSEPVTIPVKVTAIESKKNKVHRN